MNGEHVILNPVSNVQNVITGDNLDDIVGKTCKQLTQQLLNISGPYARNSFIMHDAISLVSGTAHNDMRKYGDGTKVFTKDGRKTLNTIEYASPAQRYIKDEIVTRIGEIIDNECSDGTTSSMIYTISFLMAMTNNRHKLEHISTTDIEKAYIDVMNKINTKMEETSITVEGFLSELNRPDKPFGDKVFTEEEVRRTLGYMQAYTSSSGNVQIAEAIATVISKMPVSTWGDEIIQEYSIAETKEGKVEAVEYRADIIFDSIMLSYGVNNIERGTAFSCDDCYLLTLRSGITHGSLVSNAISTYINTLLYSANNDDGDSNEAMVNEFNALKKSKYFVVVIPAMVEQHDQAYAESLFAPLLEHGIKTYFVGYQRPRGHECEGNQWYRVDAIAAKADVELADDVLFNYQLDTYNFASVQPCVIKGASVYIDRYRTLVSNVIDWSRVDDIEPKVIDSLKASNLHPGEKYPEKYPVYTDFKSFLLGQIDRYLSRDGDPHEVTIRDLKDSYTLARCIRPWIVRITGKSRDQQMLQYVIDDAAGAAIQSLRDGLHFNGPIKFCTAVSSELMRTVEKDEYSPNLFLARSVILRAMFQASQDMVYSMFGPYSTRMTTSIEEIIEEARGTYRYLDIYADYKLGVRVDAQPFSYLDTITPRDVLISHISEVPETIDDTAIMRFVRGYLLKEDTQHGVPPCQVGNLVPVLLDRIREVCLRFVCSSSIIAPRTVWDDGQISNKN